MLALRDSVYYSLTVCLIPGSLCKNGQVKVLSHSEPVQQNDSEEGKKDLCKPVMLMSFCYEEKTNKVQYNNIQCTL